jgi:hypothetical protein
MGRLDVIEVTQNFGIAGDITRWAWVGWVGFCLLRIGKRDAGLSALVGCGGWVAWGRASSAAGSLTTPRTWTCAPGAPGFFTGARGCWSRAEARANASPSAASAQREP